MMYDLSPMDIDKIRADFPALSQTLYENHPLIYLDNAATTQKPQCVLDVLAQSYTYRNANIHRGVHYLSREATEAHERARSFIAEFVGAESPDEIIFTRGTTEGINLVASTFCPRFMIQGDEVIVTAMEHHSNIVPWQMQARTYGIRLVVVPISDEGVLDMDAYRKAFSDRTRLVSVCHASNVLGTVNPIKDMIAIAHEKKVPVCIDGAQAIAHKRVNVRDLDADFYAFSGHKVYGPTGVGVLYGKRKWLEEIPPYQGGGEMIKSVSFEHTEYNDLPYKFEAGTPDFIGSVALHRALEYVQGIGYEAIAAHEESLLSHATYGLEEIPGVRIFGKAPGKEAVISFLVEGVHPYDLGTFLDHAGVALRTGHHCAQPLMKRYGIEGTLRVSFGIYNTMEEIDTFLALLKKVLPMLSV